MKRPETPPSDAERKIAEAVDEIANEIASGDSALGGEMSEQIKVHAIALAMYNAVAEQQRRAMLRNALAAATARALLESDPKEALRLFDMAVTSDDIVEALTGLSQLMDESTAKGKRDD